MRNNSNPLLTEAMEGAGLLLTVINLLFMIPQFQLRQQRKQKAFNIFMKKYPNRRLLLARLYDCPSSKISVEMIDELKETPDQLYPEFVMNKIIKNVNVWRILGNVLFGGIIGTIYQSIKNDEVVTADSFL